MCVYTPIKTLCAVALITYCLWLYDKKNVIVTKNHTQSPCLHKTTALNYVPNKTETFSCYVRLKLGNERCFCLIFSIILIAWCCYEICGTITIAPHQLIAYTHPHTHTQPHTANSVHKLSEVNIIQLHIWLTRFNYTEAFKPITPMVFIQISDITLTICGTT